jgi:predicted phage tail protein
LHGVAVWALLLVIVTAAAIFAPETLQQVVPELAGAAPAGLGDLVLGTLALAGLFAAALGGIWGGPRRERGRA